MSEQQVAKDAEGWTLVYVEGAREAALRAAVAGGVVVDGDPGRTKAAVAEVLTVIGPLSTTRRILLTG